MTSLNTRFRPVGRIVIRSIGDELLLVPISGPAAGNCIYPLNETAKVVWDCLSAHQTLREIIAELTRHFEVTPEAAETDCRILLQTLQREGLITAAPPQETDTEAVQPLETQ